MLKKVKSWKMEDGRQETEVGSYEYLKVWR